LTKDTYATLNFGIGPTIMLLFNTDIWSYILSNEFGM